MKQTVRFISTAIAVYTGVIGVIGLALYPITPFFAPAQPVMAIAPVPTVPQLKTELVIAGTPNRLVIPDYSIDLKVGEGSYDQTSNSWTLNATDAFYATMTAQANTVSGNTLIYGHGTAAVFGKLGDKIPPAGTMAEVYTTTNHVFRYSFTDARNLAPNDTTVLAENPRPATLTIQTCTGAFSEWRTMFRFQFQEMIQ